MTDQYLNAIENELKRVTQSSNPQYAAFFNMLRYHLGWTDAQGAVVQADTGKRIRPVLCLWTCEAVGADWRDALGPAAGIELIHNFSLIHDDIQDNSEFRRGRPTVWNIWGMAQGINAGDAMFVLAHDAISNVPSSLTLERLVGIQKAFNTAILKLTQGQYLDLAYERADQVTLDQYFEMVCGKTAALVAAACEIGARVGSADPALHSTMAQFGEQLGIAFQIADDVLGMWGDPEITGKSAHTDLISRKKSYPVLYAMQADSSGALRALYSKPEWEPADYALVEQILQTTDARAHALTQAESYANRAGNALRATALDNPAVTRLQDLVPQLVYRDK